MAGIRPEKLLLPARLLLGAVFVYAAWGKIMDPGGFAEVVFKYQLLPTDLVNLAALTLPWVELTAGLLAISGRWTFASVAVLAALLLVFSSAVGFNLARGLDFQCGCFSTAADVREAGRLTLARSLGLFLVAAFCLWAAGRRRPA